MDIKRMVYLKPRKTPHLKFLTFLLNANQKRKEVPAKSHEAMISDTESFDRFAIQQIFLFLSTHLFQMHDFSPFPAPIPKVGRRPQTFGKCGIIPILLVRITAVSSIVRHLMMLE